MMTQRLKEEHRRLTFVTLLAFVAGALMYSGQSGLAFGLPVPIFAGMLYAIGIGGACLLMGLMAPSLVTLSESTAVARIGLALLVLQFPGLHDQVIASPLVNATCVVGGGLILQRLPLWSAFKTWLEAPYTARPAPIFAMAR